MSLHARFTSDDPMGLWKAGDEAEWLGQESPAIPLLHLFRLPNGEVISLTEPFRRGLLEFPMRRDEP